MDIKVGIIGAGYVGMAMTSIIGHAGIMVIAYDNDLKRIEELKHGIDKYSELSIKDLSSVIFTNDSSELSQVNHYIVMVPTPINAHLTPDLSAIKKSSCLLGETLNKEDVVIFESTVYPGATEELMIPILEERSGMVSGKDFYVGYSPERVVPGDSCHGLLKTIKVVSGQNDATLKKIVDFYGRVLSIKLHVAPNIKVAESSKLLENIQRDVNIALMNEYTQAMYSMDIEMREVLKAAESKWNFLPFKPGFVGGHCIPIDPYYLMYQENKYRYSCNLINTARQTNESFVTFISQRLVQLLNLNGVATKGAKVALLGMSYKANVPDIRHSLSVHLYKLLESYGMKVYAHDPVVNEKGSEMTWINWNDLPSCRAVVLLQPHEIFKKYTVQDLEKKLSKNAVMIDMPGLYSKRKSLLKKITYWSL